MQQLVSRTSQIVLAGEPSANPFTPSPHPMIADTGLMTTAVLSSS